MSKPIRNQDWIESQLSALSLVEWDRFTIGDWNGTQSVSAYGWIDREDEYKDFVLIIFWAENEELYYISSSDEYTVEIHQTLFDESPEEHNDCRRVEHTFDVENAIELTEQAKLTDGGADYGEGPDT